MFKEKRKKKNRIYIHNKIGSKTNKNFIRYHSHNSQNVFILIQPDTTEHNEC